jgi:hypothetical protein
MRDETAVKSFWEQFVKNAQTAAASVASSTSELGTASKDGKAPKSELVMLEAAVQKGHQELITLYQNNKTEFPEKWKAKTEVNRHNATLKLC